MHRLFSCKTLLFLVLCFISISASAQVTDSTFQKQQLNQGLPPAEPTPVIVTPPAEPEIKVKEKIKTKEEKPEEESGLKKKYFTGGSGSLSFGSYKFIQVAPILGYQLTNRLAIGTGLSYIYVNNGFEHAHIYGGKLFAQAMVYNNFFAHGEYEILDFRNQFPAVLVGAGYRQMFSDRAGFDLMLLFDVNQNTRSYYTNPVFRGGFIIYLN